MQTIPSEKMHSLTGLLAAVPSWVDQALLVEKEVGMDNIYAMISNGLAVERLAASLSITKDQMKFYLTRTTKHRKKYINARAFQQAESSMDMLDDMQFKKAVELEKEQMNAAKHHNTIVDRAINVLNKSDEAKGSEPIVVNNTVVVRDSSDVAPLPDELTDFIDGEFDAVP